MQKMTLDTLGYAKHLEAAGVPRLQAEAFAEAFQKSFGPELATSEDVGRFGRRVEAMMWRTAFITIAGLSLLLCLLV